MRFLALALLLQAPLGFARGEQESWVNPPKELPKGAEHRSFESGSMKREVGFKALQFTRKHLAAR